MVQDSKMHFWHEKIELFQIFVVVIELKRPNSGDSFLWVGSFQPWNDRNYHSLLLPINFIKYGSKHVSNKIFLPKINFIVLIHVQTFQRAVFFGIILDIVLLFWGCALHTMCNSDLKSAKHMIAVFKYLPFVENCSFFKTMFLKYIFMYQNLIFGISVINVILFYGERWCIHIISFYFI